MGCGQSRLDKELARRKAGHKKRVARDSVLFQLDPDKKSWEPQGYDRQPSYRSLAHPDEDNRDPLPDTDEASLLHRGALGGSDGSLSPTIDASIAGGKSADKESHNRPAAGTSPTQRGVGSSGTLKKGERVFRDSGASSLDTSTDPPAPQTSLVIKQGSSGRLVLPKGDIRTPSHIIVADLSDVPSGATTPVVGTRPGMFLFQSSRSRSSSASSSSASVSSRTSTRRTKRQERGHESTGAGESKGDERGSTTTPQKTKPKGAVSKGTKSKESKSKESKSKESKSQETKSKGTNPKQAEPKRRLSTMAVVLPPLKTPSGGDLRGPARLGRKYRDSAEIASPGPAEFRMRNGHPLARLRTDHPYCSVYAAALAHLSVREAMDRALVRVATKTHDIASLQAHRDGNLRDKAGKKLATALSAGSTGFDNLRHR